MTTDLPRLTPRDLLDLALDDAHTAGLPIPCQQDRPAQGAESLWLSDDPEDRATAALRCRLCPALDPCARAADAARESFGVWGGADRTTRARGPDCVRLHTEHAGPERPVSGHPKPRRRDKQGD